MSPFAGDGFRPFQRSAIEQSIGERFDAVVRRASGSPAVRDPLRALTYGELASLVRAAAARVLDTNPEGGGRIALLVDQGAEFAVAFLAVLGAGQVAVPLDPSHPVKRLRWILDDAGAGVIVCSSRHGELARALTAGRAMLELDAGRGDGSPGTRSVVEPDAPAYIFYTSGSTGPPKGVVDTHRNVLHNVMRYTNGLRIAPSDRLSLLQSPAFSGGISSLLGALLNGASVFPIDFRANGPAAAGHWIAEQELTIYHSVPAIFRAVVAAGKPPESLRLVRLEGDQASVADAELFKRRFARGCRLVNGLGATECGIVRQLFVDHDTELSTPTLPVGYPVEDMDVLVVDGEGNELPAGEVGEVVVRSRYLSPGYWRRPDRTAAVFEERAGEPGLRRYRTGDLGRLHLDGCLEYLGRRDHIPKVRGERVEVEAIEAVLVSSGLAGEAAVTTRDRPDGTAQVVAFLVPRSWPGPSREALRRRVASVLPLASVPGEFVFVAALPLSEHGKLDRSALGALEGVAAPSEAHHVAPRDALEQHLAEVWADVLRLPEVGVRTEFTDLGGDSLAAASVLAAVETAYGIELPYSLFATHGTIEALAAAIGAHSGLPPDEPVVPVGGEVGGGPPVFFAHGDTVGGGLYCRRLARELRADRSLLAIAPARPGPEGRLASVEETASARAAVIERIRPSGPLLIAGGGACAQGSLLAYEIARQLEARGREVASLVILSGEPSNAFLGARILRSGIAACGPLVGFDRRRQEDLFLRVKEANALVRRGRRPAERDAYARAEATYVPRPYPGPIVVLWPAGARPSLRPPAVTWGALSPKVEVVTVPGDHQTAVTVHAEETGRILGEILRRADRAAAARR